MTEVVRVKRLLRKLYLIKKSLFNNGPLDKETVKSYYSLQGCLFKEFGIDEVYPYADDNGTIVYMTNGEKYYFDYDELYTPSTWADYDEEDEPLDEEF